MKKNRLIVGGYSCIRAVKSYIDQAVQENDRILINVSLLSRIEKIADDSDEIRQSHKRGQIVTLSYKSSPADIVLDDIIVKSVMYEIRLADSPNDTCPMEYEALQEIVTFD